MNLFQKCHNNGFALGGPIDLITSSHLSPLCSDRIRYGFSNKASFLFTVLSLQELCCRSIVSATSVHTIDRLPLPTVLHSQLRSYALASGCARIVSSSSKLQPGASRNHRIQRSASFHHSSSDAQQQLALKKSRLASHVQQAKLTCNISWLHFHHYSKFLKWLSLLIFPAVFLNYFV